MLRQHNSEIESVSGLQCCGELSVTAGETHRPAVFTVYVTKARAEEPGTGDTVLEIEVPARPPLRAITSVCVTPGLVSVPTRRQGRRWRTLRRGGRVPLEMTGENTRAGTQVSIRELGC